MRLACAFLLAMVAGVAHAGEITDATGRTVAIPDHPARVLPAGPPAAVLLEALAPDLMIGWPHALSPAQKAFLPPAVAGLPQIPMLTGPVDETASVPALHPDLVLDYGTVSRRYVTLDEAIQERTGVPTILLDGGLTHLPSVLRALGRTLRREARAEQLARAAEAVLARRSAVRPTVVYARGPDGLDIAAPGTDAAQVFEVLGWTVLAPAGRGPFRHAPDVAAIDALDPDVLIFQDPAMRGVASSPAWRGVRAVRQGHAFIAPALPFGWFGQPPSLNRLLGVAGLANTGGARLSVDARLITILVGRPPSTTALAALESQLQPVRR